MDKVESKISTYLQSELIVIKKVEK
jgi:hypothetical protein